MPRPPMGALTLVTMLALAATSPAHSATRIGATSIASNEVKGVLGSTLRTLGVGESVYQNEKISTGSNGRVQLLFLDETSMTLGPSSTVVLNRLVYDPSSNKKSQLVLNAVSGAFRFVSGSGDKKGYKVKTPAGTIGIRGTIVDIAIGGNTTMVRGVQGVTRFCGRGMPNRQGRFGLNREKCVTLRAGSYLLAGEGFITDARTTRFSPCGSSYCNILGDRQNEVYIRNILRPTTPPPPSGAPIPNRGP